MEKTLTIVKKSDVLRVLRQNEDRAVKAKELEIREGLIRTAENMKTGGD